LAPGRPADSFDRVDLPGLISILRDYEAGDLPIDEVRARLLPVIQSDPLDVAFSDPERWDAGHDDERLFWRLVYLVDDEGAGPELRDAVRRIVACIDDTRSAATTHELLPVVLDAPRLCAIVEKHRAGIVSRTSLLSVVAESGYPNHVKLWLQHASPVALQRLCAQLQAGAYAAVAAGFETPPI
jgi:hypothetical protein